MQKANTNNKEIKELKCCLKDLLNEILIDKLVNLLEIKENFNLQNKKFYDILNEYIFMELNQYQNKNQYEEEYKYGLNSDRKERNSFHDIHILILILNFYSNSNYKSFKIPNFMKNSIYNYINLLDLSKCNINILFKLVYVLNKLNSIPKFNVLLDRICNYLNEKWIV